MPEVSIVKCIVTWVWRHLHVAPENSRKLEWKLLRSTKGTITTRNNDKNYDYDDINDISINNCNKGLSAALCSAATTTTCLLVLHIYSSLLSTALETFRSPYTVQYICIWLPLFGSYGPLSCLSSIVFVIPYPSSTFTGPWLPLSSCTSSVQPLNFHCLSWYDHICSGCIRWQSDGLSQQQALYNYWGRRCDDWRSLRSLLIHISAICTFIFRHIHIYIHKHTRAPTPAAKSTAIRQSRVSRGPSICWATPYSESPGGSHQRTWLIFFGNKWFSRSPTNAQWWKDKSPPPNLSMRGHLENQQRWSPQLHKQSTFLACWWIVLAKASLHTYVILRSLCV